MAADASHSRFGMHRGIYDMDAAMEQNVRQLKASVPDLTHYFDLMDHMHEQPENRKVFRFFLALGYLVSACFLVPN